MAERDVLLPRSDWQAQPKCKKYIDTDNARTMPDENEPAQRVSCLSEPYKSFWEELQKKDIAKKEEAAAEKEHRKTLERMRLDHEKAMMHLKIEHSIQIEGLTEEKQELQDTINNYERLLMELRGTHAKEIAALTRTTELLQSDVKTKSKEAMILRDNYNAQIRALTDERAELPIRLARAALEALGLPSNAVEQSFVAAAAKGAGPIPQQPKAKTQRFPRCTQCMRHNWDCDRGVPCRNCSLQGIKKGCKRVMCENYKKNACKNDTCRFAHEGDKWRVVPYEDVWGDGREMSPVELDRMGLW